MLQVTYGLRAVGVRDRVRARVRVRVRAGRSLHTARYYENVTSTFIHSSRLDGVTTRRRMAARRMAFRTSRASATKPIAWSISAGHTPAAASVQLRGSIKTRRTLGCRRPAARRPAACLWPCQPHARSCRGVQHSGSGPWAPTASPRPSPPPPTRPRASGRQLWTVPHGRACSTALARPRLMKSGGSR